MPYVTYECSFSDLHPHLKSMLLESMYNNEAILYCIQSVRTTDPVDYSALVLGQMGVHFANSNAAGSGYRQRLLYQQIHEVLATKSSREKPQVWIGPRFANGSIVVEFGTMLEAEALANMIKNIAHI